MRTCEIIMVGGVAHRFIHDEVRGPIWLMPDGSLPSEEICPSAAVWATYEEWKNWRDKSSQERIAYAAKSI